MLAVLAVLVLGVGLGGARRLSYHEAIVAQGARELLAPEADWLVPTLGGRPWLEKPPLAHWLVAGGSRVLGGVTEASSRLPSALAAAMLAGVVACLASRHFGRGVGLLAGAAQLTALWSIHRGRLADADMLLALLVAAAILAADRLRDPARPIGPDDRDDRDDDDEGDHDHAPDPGPAAGWHRRLARRCPGTLEDTGGQAAGATRNHESVSGEIGADRSEMAWRWAFFALIGGTSLVKGIGFGAVLAMGSVGAVMLWDRDARLARRLLWPAGWLLAGLVALAWPLAVAARFPEALPLWLGHVTDRLASEPRQFAGEPIGEFLLTPIVQALPWTPLALVGAWHSLRRARNDRGGLDRLLWAWAVVPTGLLSLASVRNGHYLIHALAPWSIWAALGLARLGDRLRRRRGWSADRLRLASVGLFGTIGLAVAAAHLTVIPRLDHRGREWSWYAEASRHVPADSPLVLLYDWDGPDPWDRLPYPTPFGPIPPDLAVRLFYLDRDPPALWRSGPDRLAADPPVSTPFAVIARDRDLPALRSLGPVAELSRGPDHRWDRSYALFRVEPVAARPDRLAGGHPAPTRER